MEIFCLEFVGGISLYMMIFVDANNFDSSTKEAKVENKGGNRCNFYNLKIKKNWRSTFYSSIKEEENRLFFKDLKKYWRSTSP